MQLFLTLGNFQIPTYGLMIAFGLISANIIACFVIKKYNLDSNDFILIEAYTLLGGFVGAKLLYLVVERNTIDWYRFFRDSSYFTSMIQGGFVFYGGLLGGLLCLLLASKLHNINSMTYVRRLLFLIPWIHGFGRIGCFLAGCCYGIPYTGLFAVQFPEGSLAPSHTALFPVQIVEAFILLFLAGILLLLCLRDFSHPLPVYLICYAIIRFSLEYYRYDMTRGHFLFFSTSQWISCAMVLLAILLLVIPHIRNSYKRRHPL